MKESLMDRASKPHLHLSPSGKKTSVRSQVEPHPEKIPAFPTQNLSNQLPRRFSYLQQNNILKKLKRCIAKITPSTSWYELDGYRTEMSHLLDFFESEKSRLDTLIENQGGVENAFQEAITAQTTEEEAFKLPRSISQLSQEIEILKAKALEASVELDLRVDAVSDCESEGPENQASTQVYGRLQRLCDLLFDLYEKSSAYQELTLKKFEKNRPSNEYPSFTASE